jgi:Peptidase family C25
VARQATLSAKIVVTNRTALRRKYGSTGIAAIEQAVRALATADAKRGFDTRLVYLDAASLGKARVTDTADPVQNKAAVDAIATRYRPEYLVILGSHDVVPYQDMKNKLHVASDPESDPDRFAPSDLPYACESVYGQDVTRFLGPTRVVGRVPDLTGATSPDYLITQLGQIAAARPLPRPDSAFALSAALWIKSTQMSVRNLLGATPVVLASPTAGPVHPVAQLRELVHFVNCHGNKSDHTFSGEGPRNVFAPAMDARKLKGIRAGTVAAFECCFGAELYDPAGLPAMSIANAYLQHGAVGLVASTTISYGPADGNGNADIICQLFLEQLLRGASLGRAFLEARLGYVRGLSVVDPYDEKTLAQFVLLGDPSLHPFVEPGAVRQKSTPAAKSAVQAARRDRRARLMKAGERIGRETSFTVQVRSAQRAAGALRNKALATAKKHFRHVRVFQVKEPPAERRAAGKALRDMPKATTVFIATKQRRHATSDTSTARVDGLLVYQLNGSFVEIALVSR